MYEERIIGKKPKTIRRILRKKIDSWIKTIDDKELQVAVKENVIVTGGSIASMLLGEKVNDFDVYFQNYETTLKVANYYINKFTEKKKSKDIEEIFVEEGFDVRNEPRIRIIVKSAGVESEEREKNYHYFEYGDEDKTTDYIDNIYNDPGEIANQKEIIEHNIKENTKRKGRYHPVFLSTNAITLSDDIQIVLRFFGSPEEIHKNFDFMHCTNYYDYNENKLHLRSDALSCLLSRTLIYQSSRYPLTSLFRIRKFIKRGWRINAGQIFKIALQISELDLNDYNVLEDSLTGVDVAYFTEILDICKNNFNEEGKIESAYLIEIVDKMFSDE